MFYYQSISNKLPIHIFDGLKSFLDIVTDVHVFWYIRGLSQKFVDARCYHLIFNIYKYCCIWTERLINTDFIDTQIVIIVLTATELLFP